MFKFPLHPFVPVSKVPPSERLKRVLWATDFAGDDVFISVGTRFEIRPPLSVHVHFGSKSCGIVDNKSHPTFFCHNQTLAEAMINMSPPIPFLMPNPITEGLRKLELSDAISSGRVLMPDMVKRLPWYGTYCMPARAWINLSVSLVIGSGMICRLLEGLATRQACSTRRIKTSCA